jgi:hypothetical protein
MATTPDSNQGTNQGTNTGTTSNITPAQFQAQVTSTLAAADTSATQSVANLKLVKQARLSQLTRTAASLTAKYGASDPRVIAAQATVAATTATVGRVSMVHQQLATPAVPVTATGWALNGQVLDAKLQPAAKFTVFLVDANKTFLRQYGFAYTDDNGYFLINYAGDATSSSTAPASPTEGTEEDGTITAGDGTTTGGDGTTTAGTITAGTTMPGTTATVPGATTATQLYIEVANPDANPVYLSSTAFQPVLGSATFQNIVLPAGGQPLGDPPAAVREVALPQQQAKTKTTSTWWRRNR